MFADDDLEDDEPEDEPGRFTPKQLDRTVLALPLLTELNAERKQLAEGKLKEPRKHPVVVELNLEHPQSRDKTRDAAVGLIRNAIEDAADDKSVAPVNEAKSRRSEQYLFARLEGDVIRRVVQLNEDGRPIFRIWPDFEIGRL